MTERGCPQPQHVDEAGDSEFRTRAAVSRLSGFPMRRHECVELAARTPALRRKPLS